MSDEVLIKKIVTALEDKLADLAIADHMDALNALTEIIIETLKTNEFLSAPEAYQRASEVFKDAAVAEEVEAAAEAAAKAKRRRHAAATNAQIKFEQFKKRQQRVAQRQRKREKQMAAQP
jgi:hypothetical protein